VGSPLVVDERVHGLLEQATLVVHDGLRRLDLHDPAQAVVAVDDAAIEIVDIGGGEAAAIELHHGA